MDAKNRLLFRLSKNILARNSAFKGVHKGKSCYIFGNGISLKNMDLRKFDDRISIGCGFIHLHREVGAINLKYCSELHPFYYYPFWTSPYTGSREKNLLGHLSRRSLRNHRNLQFFCNLSNYFGLRGDNVHYLHHFGSRAPSLDRCELDGSFSFMKNALYGMIGMAIYMGFESAMLVGCDYTHSPMRSLHFYEKGEGVVTPGKNYFERDFFELVKHRIDITTITMAGAGSDVLKHVEYRDHVGENAVFRENTEIVRKEDLDVLAASRIYKIY